MNPTSNIVSQAKIFGWLFSGAKKSVSEDRIAKYTTVSTAFRPEETNLIKSNLDEISKYAEANRCNLSFRPSYKHKDSFRMEVDERVVKTYDPADGSKAYKAEVLEKRGSALLPKSLQSNEDLLNAIKTEASKLLYKGN